MQLSEPSIFVVDMAGAPAFAFAAETLDSARQIARSDWLLRAIQSFCDHRPRAAQGPLTVRSATPNEAALYRDRADEFAEAEPRFVIAHLV